MKTKMREHCALAIGQLQAVMGELKRSDFEGCAVLETLAMAHASIERARQIYLNDDVKTAKLPTVPKGGA